MTQEPDDHSTLMHQLDKSEEFAITVGLIGSGMVFAAGVAGLLYVIVRVESANPPSFGSQGEWLYGALACLLVAGWGFSKAAGFYARRRAGTPGESPLKPTIRVGSKGVSFEMGSPQPQASEDSTRGTWTWSFNSAPISMKALTVSEAQVAAADGHAQAGLDWDEVCRTISPEYAALSAVEQKIYREALRAAVESHRRKE